MTHPRWKTCVNACNTALDKNWIYNECKENLYIYNIKRIPLNLITF